MQIFEIKRKEKLITLKIGEDRLKKIKRLHYQVESHIETNIVYKLIEGVTLGR